MLDWKENMEPILNAKPFDILVTLVEKEHGLVKIFGQRDLKTSQVSAEPRVEIKGGNSVIFLFFLISFHPTF